LSLIRAGIVLAGGSGLRLGPGPPKALRVFGGTTLLERALQLLSVRVERVFVAVPHAFPLHPDVARYERVDDLANGLLALGVAKGDVVAILGSTSLEWCLFDFALGLIGAVGAPIYANSSARDCAHVIGHSDAIGVLVEDEEQLAKVEQVRAELPGLRHVLTFSGLPELEAAGRRHAAEHPEALEDAASRVEEDDLFTLI
jgi:hypothetical protein